ncbi:MAG: acyl-CoA thioesterase [Candidatus Bipolaricaulia bacterium]
MTNRLQDFPVLVQLPVVWGEMDAFGHVNNTVFFRYFETARLAYFERIAFGESSQPSDVGPILASTSCRFRRPLTYPDTIHVGARVSEVEDDRFTMAYEIYSEAHDDIAAKGEGVIVAYDYANRQKAPLPDDVRQRIRALDPTATDG